MTQQWQIQKLSDDAIIPTRGHEGDLGYDLYSCENVTIKPNETVSVGTGTRIYFPEGWGAVIHNRSSMSLFKSLVVGGGVIDQGYRGEIKVIFHNVGNDDVQIKIGDKIAQIIPTGVQNVEFTPIDGSGGGTNTSRGEAGFGSTDNV